MNLDKPEQEIFEEIIEDFCNEYGRESLKGIYKLAKRFRDELGLRIFPTLPIYHHLLYEDLKHKYNDLSLKKIASVENIPLRTIYYFFNTYVKKRRKGESGIKKLLPPK